MPRGSIRLHLNECQYPVPDFIIERVLEVLRNCNQYPSKELFNRFRELIAEYAKVDVENVYPFTGADSALRTIFNVLAKPGNSVLYVEPTFTMIKVYIANNNLKGLQVMSFEGDDWWYVEIEDLLSKAKQADIAILVDPNNPTGSPIINADKGAAEALSRMVSRYIVFDEVYYEFAGYTVAPFITDLPNIVIVRSLSKAFCLAGFRLGYVIGDKEVISRISSIHTPFDIPTPSLAAGIAALENRQYMEKIVEEVKAVREFLYINLKGKVRKVFKSLANFLLIKDERDLDSTLRKYNIYVKKVSSGLYRLTVPPPAIANQIVKILGEAV